MGKKDNRQFTRMSIRWAVQLDFGEKRYRYFVDNLSLSGFLVKGECRQEVGDICKITIKESAFYIESFIHAVGLIVRITEQAVALEFVCMKLNSFCCLQASLLTKAIKPSVLANEIAYSDKFDFIGDLVINSAHNLALREIRCGNWSFQLSQKEWYEQLYSALYPDNRHF